MFYFYQNQSKSNQKVIKNQFKIRILMGPGKFKTLLISFQVQK